MATTADAYYPYDAGTGSAISEAQWRTMMGNVINTGVISDYLNGLAVTGDSTGMQVKLATGASWVNGAYGENTAGVVTLAISASDATLHRYDLIVARNDYTSNVIEWDVVEGTPGASPSVPTVTNDSSQYELALATVYIAATVTTITAGDVADVRTYSGPTSEDLTSTVAFSAYSSSSTTVTTSATKITLGTEIFDLGADFDNATNYRFTAPTKGIYCISGRVTLSTPGSGVLCTAYLYKNGSPFDQDLSAAVNNGGANSVNLTVSGTVKLDAGDYVELYAKRGSGSGSGTGALSGHAVGHTV